MKETKIKNALDLHLGDTFLMAGVPIKIQAIRKDIDAGIAVITDETDYSFDVPLDMEFEVQERET